MATKADNNTSTDANETDETTDGNQTSSGSGSGERYKKQQIGTGWIFLFVVFVFLFGMNIYLYFTKGKTITNLLLSIGFAYLSIAICGVVSLQIEDCESYLQLTMGPVP